jgi:predicted metal-dependent HD superfamily phosphohydrolase
MLETRVVLVGEVLSAHAGALGADFEGYRNHAYRVANFCLALTSATTTADDQERIEKITLAAAFHDLGIWTDATFDYLPPSNRLANAYLAESGRSAWAPDISEMILRHQKLTHFHGRCALVEPFRRADLIDVSNGSPLSAWGENS